MKYLTLIFLFLMVLSIGCNKDDQCTSDDFAPNSYKYYFPYEKDDELHFVDDSGSKDKITIQKYALEETNYSAVDCFQPTESFECAVLLNYDSIYMCEIRFSSTLERELPYFVASSIDCAFQATFQSLSSGNGTISRVDNYQFSGNSYNALVISIDEASIGLEEIVVAKDKGFLSITIDGVESKIE